MREAIIASQEICDRLAKGDTSMRAVIVAAVVFAAVSAANPALAQKRNASAMLSDMKAKYGNTFDQCQSLAASRGYRLGDVNDEYEGMGLAMFVEGCIMGQQR